MYAVSYQLFIMLNCSTILFMNATLKTEASVIAYFIYSKQLELIKALHCGRLPNWFLNSKSINMLSGVSQSETDGKYYVIPHKPFNVAIRWTIILNEYSSVSKSVTNWLDCNFFFFFWWERKISNTAAMCVSVGVTFRSVILDGTFRLHSRTDLINSSGWEGKLGASVPQQRNKIPVISSSSSLHSSQALMSCLGNLCALCVCVYVCLSEHERGPEKPQSENYVSSERISSPRFSQGLGILLLACLRVLFNVNTQACIHTYTHTHEHCESEVHSTKAETDGREHWNWFSYCNRQQMWSRFSDRKQPKRTNLSALGSVWTCGSYRASGSKVLSFFSSHTLFMPSVFLSASK